MTGVTDVEKYINALYPHGIPTGLRTYVWTLPNRLSYWADTTEGLINHANEQELKGNDVYLGLALTDKKGNSRSRITLDDAVAVPGVWLEIDTKDAEAHKKTNLPTPVEAEDFVKGDVTEAFGPPNMVVDSGHGLHIYYLFGGLLAADTEVAELLHDIGNQVNSMLARHGWQGDSVHDLSRVLRIPGTTNRKGTPVPATLREYYENRYAFASLRAAVLPGNPGGGVGHRGGGESASTGGTRSSAPDEGDIPPFDPETRRILMDDANFKRTWNRKRGPGRPSALNDDSDSGYAYALINQCINAGLNDAMIISVLRSWMIEQGIEPVNKDGTKRDIAWMQRSINSARNSSTTSAENNPQIKGAEDAINGGDSGSVFTGLSDYLGVRVIAIRRYSNDAETKTSSSSAKYYLAIDLNGAEKEIPLGTVSNLMSQQAFRAAMLDATHGASYPPPIKREKWDGIVRSMVANSEWIDFGTELSDEGWLLDALQRYVEDKIPRENIEEAAAYNAPWIHDGAIHIFTRQFVTWANTAMGTAPTQEKIGRMLENIPGATRHQPEVGGRKRRARRIPPEIVPVPQ